MIFTVNSDERAVSFLTKKMRATVKKMGQNLERKFEDIIARDVPDSRKKVMLRKLFKELNPEDAIDEREKQTCNIKIPSGVDPEKFNKLMDFIENPIRFEAVYNWMQSFSQQNSSAKLDLENSYSNYGSVSSGCYSPESPWDSFRSPTYSAPEYSPSSPKYIPITPKYSPSSPNYTYSSGNYSPVYSSDYSPKSPRAEVIRDEEEQPSALFSKVPYRPPTPPRKSPRKQPESDSESSDSDSSDSDSDVEIIE